MSEQTRHYRLDDEVHIELRVRAVQQGLKVGNIIKELVFPGKKGMSQKKL